MFAASLIGYMSGEVAGRDVDHDDDDDDDDEKGQWNRSIASLCSEKYAICVQNAKTPLFYYAKKNTNSTATKKRVWEGLQLYLLYTPSASNFWASFSRELGGILPDIVRHFL